MNTASLRLDRIIFTTELKNYLHGFTVPAGTGGGVFSTADGGGLFPLMISRVEEEEE